MRLQEAATPREQAEHWVTHYRPLVVATCMRYLRNEADAEDAAQEVLLHLLENPDKIRSNPAAWLYQQAINTSRSYIRTASARRRRENTCAQTSDPAPTCEQLKQFETAEAVDQALNELRPQDRDLLIRLHVMRQTQQAVAQQSGIGQQAVAKRLNKAQARFRKQLKRHGVAPGLGISGALGLLAPAATTTSAAATTLIATTASTTAATAATATLATAASNSGINLIGTTLSSTSKLLFTSYAAARTTTAAFVLTAGAMTLHSSDQQLNSPTSTTTTNNNNNTPTLTTSNNYSHAHSYNHAKNHFSSRSFAQSFHHHKQSQSTDIHNRTTTPNNHPHRLPHQHHQASSQSKYLSTPTSNTLLNHSIATQHTGTSPIHNKTIDQANSNKPLELVFNRFTTSLNISNDKPKYAQNTKPNPSQDHPSHTQPLASRDLNRPSHKNSNALRPDLQESDMWGPGPWMPGLHHVLFASLAMPEIDLDFAASQTNDEANSFIMRHNFDRIQMRYNKANGFDQGFSAGVGSGDGGGWLQSAQFKRIQTLPATSRNQITNPLTSHLATRPTRPTRHLAFQTTLAHSTQDTNTRLNRYIKSNGPQHTSPIGIIHRRVRHLPANQTFTSTDQFNIPSNQQLFHQHFASVLAQVENLHNLADATATDHRSHPMIPMKPNALFGKHISMASPQTLHKVFSQRTPKQLIDLTWKSFEDQPFSPWLNNKLLDELNTLVDLSDIDNPSPLDQPINVAIQDNPPSFENFIQTIAYDQPKQAANQSTQPTMDQPTGQNTDQAPSQITNQILNQAPDQTLDQTLDQLIDEPSIVDSTIDPFSAFRPTLMPALDVSSPISSTSPPSPLPSSSSSSSSSPTWVPEPRGLLTLLAPSTLLMRRRRRGA